MNFIGVDASIYFWYVAYVTQKPTCM